MDDCDEQERLNIIHSRRLREVQARRALPVGDPERADEEELAAIDAEDHWS